MQRGAPLRMEQVVFLWIGTTRSISMFFFAGCSDQYAVECQDGEDQARIDILSMVDGNAPYRLSWQANSRTFKRRGAGYNAGYWGCIARAAMYGEQCRLRAPQNDSDNIALDAGTHHVDDNIMSDSICD